MEWLLRKDRTVVGQDGGKETVRMGRSVLPSPLPSGTVDIFPSLKGGDAYWFHAKAETVVDVLAETPEPDVGFSICFEHPRIGSPP
jgi:hypothetical protein